MKNILKKSVNIILFLCFIQIQSSWGQSTLNFGLTHPQDPVTLPRSAVPPQKSVRKPKVKPVTVLRPVQQNEWVLSGGWEMANGTDVIAAHHSLFSQAFNTSRWYNATVPGTVLTTLVNEGVYPDPYYGINNLAIPDSLCRTDWWYRIVFTLPPQNNDKHVWLDFNGINYSAGIWLNGKKLGSIHGAFTRGVFDATSSINRSGDNILAVHILPPPDPGIPHEQSPTAGRGPNGGQLCLDGPTFIATEGWDWMPGIRDRDIGIWQDVRLRYTGDVTVHDPQVITDLPLPDTTRADLTIKAEVTNFTAQTVEATVNGTIGNVAFSKKVLLPPHQTQDITFSPTDFPQLHFHDPRLWWPNGYGKQNLYNLILDVATPGQTESDRISTHFGIRELSYELTVDAPHHPAWRVNFNPLRALKNGNPIFDNIHRRDVGDGVSIPSLLEPADTAMLTTCSDNATAPYLVIRVNGRRIFCRGGNWGMDDAMKRVSRKRLEPYFKLHHDAHFNMIRNWTGESTEETFYDLCDKYGMLVWNDFWLSTQGYNLVVNDDNLFLKNAQAVIHRFRNHPCIAVWCPRNEGYAPGYIETHLARLIAKDDGTRYYQPNSRYCNLRPSGPWNYFKNDADYFRFNARGFDTEMGSPSVPTAESMRSMMDVKDTWPISDVWYYHDLHYGQKDYCNAIDSLYGAAHSLDDFCKKAQMINFNSYRAMFEAWNSKMWNNTTGLLLWMTHPAWPSTDWQVYSWDYETFGSYFGSRTACEPIHIQMDADNRKVVVVNTTLKPVMEAVANLTIYDLNGKSRFSLKKRIDLPPNRLTTLFTPSFPAGLPAVYLVRLTLTNRKGFRLSENDYWETSGQNGNYKTLNQLPRVSLTAKRLKSRPGKNHTAWFEITNPSKVMAIAIKLNLRNDATGKRILPAYFSDGYFNLLPGEKRKIRVEYKENKPVNLSTDGYNIVQTSIATIQ